MNIDEQRRNVETTVEKRWLSYSEAQEMAGIGRTKLWQLVSSGVVPAAKIGRAVRISRQGLEEYMASQNYVEAVRR